MSFAHDRAVLGAAPSGWCFLDSGGKQGATPLSWPGQQTRLRNPKRRRRFAPPAQSMFVFVFITATGP
ncbi:MAG: hypothetical protein HY735_05510 [Verrucomicrobia bacterium]|nr:hypothetical protein [Verrucomicrobiota bacterium]